jgi:hypothetical protein
MADVYGVTPDDVAEEMKNLFPHGFATSTTPTLAQVLSFIAVADLEVAIAVGNAAGVPPAASDRVAPLAKQVILNRVIARVLRIVYTGNAPSEVAALVAGYLASAGTALDAITVLQTQAAGAGTVPAAHVTTSSAPTRDLLICDSDLGPPPSRYYTGDRGRY